MSVAAGIEFPHAAQAIQIRLLDQPRRFTTEIVYAITDLQAYEAEPWQLADWIRGHWSIAHWRYSASPNDLAGALGFSTPRDST